MLLIIMNIINLVLSGGGLKGLATLGALAHLESKNLLNNVTTYCGSSSGALISLLLNIGYSAQDVYDILYEIDFSVLTSINIDCLLEDICIGFDKGDAIQYIVGMLMIKKNYNLNTTFKELHEKTGKKLIITGCCVNTVSIHYFSHETTPNMKILTAARITYSIPVIFKPVTYENKIWIDGGCMDNFPMELFKDNIENTLGILLDDKNNIDEFQDTAQYLLYIIKCLHKSPMLKTLEQFKKHVIYITPNLHLIQSSLNINKEDKQKLFNIGIENATGYCKDK